MQDLCLLLQSKDLETRSRADKIFHSMFITDPASIINSFKDFLPYFMNVLDNRRNIPIVFYSQTEYLIRYLCDGSVQIQDSAVDPILLYFLEVLSASPQNTRVDPFVIDTFNKSDIREAVMSIFKSVRPAEHLTLLFKLFVVSEDKEIKSLIESNTNEICALIHKAPSDFSDVIIRGLQSQNMEISSFIASMMLRMISQNTILMELLSPYTCYLKTLIDSPKIRELALVLENHILKQKQAPAPIDVVHKLLGSITSQGALFSATDAEPKRRIVSTASESKYEAHSFSKKLETSILDLPIDYEAPESITIVPKSAEPVAPVKPEVRKEILSCFAHKLGGFQHSSWQQRFFEFYPSNKCLIWKSKKTATEVKGMIMIGPSIGIESPKSMKGKQFVIKIKLPNKVHEIAFPSDFEKEKWFAALTEAAK